MKNLFALLIIIIFFGCKETSKDDTEEKESFTISGTIDGDYNDYIYLNYEDYKDSVKVVNSSFKFTGAVEKPMQGWLNLKPDANVVWLYIENSDIQIQTNFNKITQNKKAINILKFKEISGSKSAEIKKEYQDFYQANKDNENFKTLLYNKLETFVEVNKDHPFCGAILGELALIKPVLSQKELIQLYSKIDTSRQHKDDLKMFEMGIENLSKYGVSKPFLKFKLPNIQEENIDITNFLGKTTLVDFWASWCAPCRKKHPDLIQLKEKYKNDDFDIVSVSIDKKRNDWIKAIEKDNLKWTNLIDIDWAVYNELGIIAVPYNYLIDEKGVVIGVNLSVEQIDEILDKKVDM